MILYTCYFIFNSDLAIAQSSTGQNYKLEIDEINTAPDSSENTEQPIPVIEEQEKDVEETIGGIKSIAQAAPIIFSTSSNIADFGTLTPGNPVTRNTTLSVTSSGTDYQIISFEDHPLTGSDNQRIADTTCDNGGCSETEEAIWENQLTYGFGFRCISKINFICLGFSQDNTYKQFSDIQRLEVPQILAIGRKSSEEKTAQVNFKLNTSGNQKTGSYENTITFIAIPSY